MNTSVELKISTQFDELKQAIRDLLAENCELRTRILDQRERIECLEEQLEVVR